MIFFFRCILWLVVAFQQTSLSVEQQGGRYGGGIDARTRRGLLASGGDAKDVKKRILLLNALNGPCSVASALIFAESLIGSDHLATSKAEPLSPYVHLFTKKSFFEASDESVRSKIKDKYHISFVKAEPLPDRSRGRLNPPTERVTAILEALEAAATGSLKDDLSGNVKSFSSSAKADDFSVLSLGFSNDTSLVPRQSFLGLYGRLSSSSSGGSRKADVLLLAKSHRLTGMI
jgi:hypothetical protein